MTQRSEHHPTAPSDDVQAVTQLFADFLAGWNAGSGERFAAGFADPCDFIAFDGTHLTSRGEIEVVHQDLFDTWLRGSRLTGRHAGSAAGQSEELANGVPVASGPHG